MPVPVVWKSKLISSPSPMQPVGREGEAVAVDLEAVAQPGLDDAHVAVDLIDQAVDVGHELVGHVADVPGDDGAEQQAAEPGRRIDRQHEVAERDAGASGPADACATPRARPAASGQSTGPAVRRTGGRGRAAPGRRR